MNRYKLEKLQKFEWKKYLRISNTFQFPIIFFLYKHKVYKYTEAEIHFKNNQKNIQKNPWKWI